MCDDDYDDDDQFKDDPISHIDVKVMNYVTVMITCYWEMYIFIL